MGTTISVDKLLISSHNCCDFVLEFSQNSAKLKTFAKQQGLRCPLADDACIGLLNHVKGSPFLNVNIACAIS